MYLLLAWLQASFPSPRMWDWPPSFLRYRATPVKVLFGWVREYISGNSRQKEAWTELIRVKPNNKPKFSLQCLSTGGKV